MNDQEFFNEIIDDISVVEGNKKELIVFADSKDTSSFLELLQLNKQINNRTLITLNSGSNAKKFLNRYQNYDGKIFLCLTGDRTGNMVTLKILTEFNGKNIKDVRPLYEISENRNQNLSEYLKNKLGLQNKNTILVEPKNSEDANLTIKRNGIPNTQHVGSELSERNSGKPLQSSQSEQNGNHLGGQAVGGINAGNGLAGTKRSNLGNRDRGGRPNDGTQQNDDEKNEGREHSLGGIVSGRIVSDRRESGGRVSEVNENSTQNDELETLIEKYKGQKLTNEQVAEVISVTCFVSGDNKIVLKDNLTITDDLKEICNQFRSGGTAKEGRGILDEYYTDSKIVDTVCNLIKDHFKNQKEISVLEPSVGTGNFLYITHELSVNSKITGFEINETTAKIAKILHPEADINLRSFETEFIDEKGNKKEFSQQYDLIIGNPPYGEHRGLYKGLGEEPKISKYEDYFVKRSLDSLKPNGVLAMVLPSGWLNRQKNLQNANLLEAFRLPNGAFAGTQIGTDIIILRKKEQNISVDISSYFETHPSKVLGENREKINRFGRLENYVHGNLDEALFKIEQIKNKKETERIGNLFEDLFLENTEPNPITKASPEKEIIAEEKNELNLTETQEKIELVLSKLNNIKFKSPTITNEISKYEKLREDLITKPASFSEEKLKELIEKSDRIISIHNTKLDNEYKIQTKPEIKKSILKYQFLKQDVIVNTSLQNSSEITKEQIEAFRDTSYDGTLNNRGKHYQFANYIDGNWVHDFYYKEGNIYAKLEQLERDFIDKNAIGGTVDQYEKQKALLENVLPKAKSLDEIFISPNHEFVHKFGLGTVEKLRYNSATRSSEPVIENYNLAEKFKDFVSDLPSEAFAGSSSWEVKTFVDNETVTGSDKERNALVRERRKAAANDLFHKFVREELSDELRNRFVKDFNRNYNNIHVPDYSKFPLFSRIYQNFKGKPLKLSEVQKAGIGRQTTKGVGLLAHEVGFGKTLSGILSMHEAMERGNATRPLIVVPNDSILKQWVETIFETIPNAKVNVLGNLGKDYDLSKFDNKDEEITIVTYEGFNNIGFAPGITQELASKFNYISESELKSVTNTERDLQIELQKEKEIEGKMKRGKIYDWEDFGFDHLTYDEVHNANHIVGKVKIEDRRFASDFRGQNQQTSKLGINTWMACQYIQDKCDGRNVTLLSATPFTNKPLEYYSILSLIANKRLEESGYFNVNTFFETFMEADNDMEIDAKGDVKFKANVRRFKNNSLFQQLLSEFIDIKGEEDNPELIRPNKINKEYKIEQNILTKAQYDLLNENFDEVQKGAILTHILNARLIAISPYLSPYYTGLEPSYKFFVEDSPKLKQTMDLIRQNKKDIPDSGQIIYSELAVKEFPKLKEYLINEVGYKPEEVGIITGATSKNQRISIQNDFNSGKIKIIIGSEAIQEGMNLQENTTDLYILSLPYNFTSLRQVEGRIWRQGNRNENVRVNFMLTNDSIDVFMLQKLQAKQARYLEAMKKGADVLDISDISTQELKTAIITNPETRANIEIELMKKRIESEKNKHLADSAFVLRKYEDFIKVQEGVTKAEYSYNRILGYSKEEGEDSEYWENQLPSYEKTIDLAKEEVQKAIQNLAEKGVNVTEIEQQTKITEDKIAELDKKLEELPEIKANLISQYAEEKAKQLKMNELINYVKERADENWTLYKISGKLDSIDNLEFKNSVDVIPLPGENMNLENVSTVVRKR
ncbi:MULTISPECIES: Eco57I restriction-modification methylase domain-containing protein [unclassified Chryseobacterium]|uniref:Eco57I restriction-modification methylase domain-containing protein n=1 Tax=unclassified Chryseobacterium TaxID=2593645 RepID=UPI000D38B62C|nr:MULTISPECIES: helicase-related protein [unclassified Chryseobacterium]PTT78436.1 restriction endonuclease subunit R [Chryseobacterium sp. HMWF001]PVV54094.1 restriction endonuclease subunit R [Chryseobacterium sp. HMWF035]